MRISPKYRPNSKLLQTIDLPGFPSEIRQIVRPGGVTLDAKPPVARAGGAPCRVFVGARAQGRALPEPALRENGARASKNSHDLFLVRRRRVFPLRRLGRFAGLVLSFQQPVEHFPMAFFHFFHLLLESAHLFLKLLQSPVLFLGPTV